MNEKLINVFFGSDNLPYKDVERTIHFPITGSAFLGASNTTKIRFYFDRIGDTSATYVSVAKLPNGKQGSQILSKSSDENGNYAELELSNWYTQAKGDVYIALQGYQGGTTADFDEETGLWTIEGNPIIQTTGSIKLAINYAPIGQVADYNDEFTTYQEILAALGDKANVDNVYTKAETDTALNGKVDKRETTGTYAYTHNGSVQGEIKVEKNDIGGAIVQRTENAQIIVPYTPSTDSNATSKRYVDTGLSGKQNTLVNQVNIKSINNQSLLGTGNIDIQGGGGGADYTAGYGIDITDDTISVDTDNIATRDFVNSSIATNTATFRGTYNVVSDLGLTTSATHQEIATAIATKLASLSIVADDNDYVFVSFPNATVSTDFDKYERYKFNGTSWEYEYTLNNSSFTADQWASINSGITSGILSGLATKTELSESIKNLAQPYDDTVIYSIGDKVIYDNKLYSCLVNMSAAESWDSTHWMQITVANGFVNLTGTQTISGQKTFDNTVYIGNVSAGWGQEIKFNDNCKIQNFATTLVFEATGGVRSYYSISPYTNNGADLGESSLAWKDLYLSGTVNIIGSKLSQGADGNLVAELSGDDKSFIPSWGGHYNLGTGGYKWKDLHLSGTANIGSSGLTNSGTQLQIKYEGNTVFAIDRTSLVPSSYYGNVDLGSSTYKFKDLYLSGNLSDGTNSVSVAHLAQNTPTQWYGTQAEFNALGTYDSNTTYNIFED